jgi:hypothetical protein
MKKLIIALLLAVTAICGQQTTTTQPAQSVTAPNFAYSMTDVLAKGATIGNHQFDNNAHLTGFPALSESGEVAFTVEFANGHKGIFTSGGRAVVEDGEDIGGGITVLQVASARVGDVQIANTGVSYLASFKGKGCVTATCPRGLFTEKSLIAIQGSGGGTYTLGEDGKITAPAGNVWLTPTSGTESGAGKKSRKSFLSSFACGLVPVVVTPNETGPGGIRIPSKAVNPCAVWAGQTAPQAAPQAPQLAKFEITPTPAFCAAPAGATFPLPWSSGASAAGPIGTVRTDGPTLGQSYKSALHPLIGGNWTRKLFFATDCRPLLVSLSANPGPALEVFTPAGLLATFSAEKGLYDFGGGIPNVTLPPASSPIESGILINRHCQALVSVRYRTSAGEQIGMALGTPKAGCAQ